MPSRTGLTERFLEELSVTLDIEKTIKKLGISREEAGSILRGLIPHRGLIPPHRRKKGAARDGAFELYVDGASRGNPGKSGAGAVIRGPGGEVVKRLKEYLGLQTNNRAEYRALIMALEAAASLGAEKVHVFADSELMVRQLNGLYRVKSPDLKPLFQRAKALLSGFKEASVAHIPRDDNGVADSLANEAIDSCGG